MGQPIEITNLEYSAADLRRLASREKRGEVEPGCFAGTGDRQRD
jgi:hypothetical protein